MVLELTILMISVIAGFFVGFFVLSKNYKSYTNRFFFLFTTFSGILSTINIISLQQTTHDGTLNYARWAIFFATLYSLSLYLTIHTFPSKTIKLNKWKLTLVLLLAAIVLPLTRTSLIFKDVTGIGSQSGVIPGPVIPLFAFATGFYILGAIFILIRRYKAERGELKAQIQNLLLGVVISSLLIFITNFIFVVLLKNVSFLIFSPIYTLIFLIFIGYAVIAHHLFEIRVLLTQVAVAIVILALVVQTFISKETPERIANAIILVLVSYGGYLLTKSILQEIRRRQEVSHLAEQLKIANDHLQELDKMKTEFVSLASHELLTPISAIQGYLSMLLDEKIVDPKSDKGLEYLTRIYGSAKRLAKLVTDLLNVSRIEEGRMLIQNKPLDINALIDNVVGELKFKAQEKQLTINWQKGNWPAIYADEEKIKEILINLIGNAIKYTLKGAIAISTQVTTTEFIKQIDLEQTVRSRLPDFSGAMLAHKTEQARQALVGDKQLVVQIKDSGIGIDSRDAVNLFRKFYRAGDVLTQQTQGTGLGLYICKALIEMMHGRIWARSVGRGQGSTFSFSLPLAMYEPQIKEVEKDIRPPENAKPLAHSAHVI